MSNQEQKGAEPRHTNRLIHETSPYLLEHAHNPVDWYSWGEEALTKAKTEDKPIVLSVGYSSCHWCHVMAHESFENEDIARLMNENFVSIKVDREERPDIDALYMDAVQALTGSGGWPMTVFLTPEGLPFYGGTYFPPKDRYGMPGFPTLLKRISDYYRTRREKVEETASQFRDFYSRRVHLDLSAIGEMSQDGTNNQASLKEAVGRLAAAFDGTAGGFGGAPKFPHPMSLDFLLHQHLRHAARNAQITTSNAAQQAQSANARPRDSELGMVEFTLEKMANGGIYDQIGGGFHRYSVDDRWLVPHFEKMLYDNALLSRAYLHAYQVTGEPFYRRIVEETLDYVQREMLSKDGGFYSTQDADSEGVEGKFYLWTPAEVKAALGEEDGALFCAFYDVTEDGNFEHKNILHVDHSLTEIAEQQGVSIERLEQALARGREVLYKVRAKRVWPGLDNKILTGWNGLMLRSFAEAARVLGRDDYRASTERTANFLLTTMNSGGRLLRSYRDGQAKLKGYLEDYANLALALLELYQMTHSPRWFSAARQLADQMNDLFWDEEDGGFFSTGNDHEELIGRPKELMDNATPSGNSAAAELLLRLAAYTGEDSYRSRAEQIVRPLVPAMAEHPSALSQMLIAFDFLVGPTYEVAIIGDPAAADTRALLDVITRQFRPNLVLAVAKPDDSEATSAVPLLQERPQRGGAATAYVCQNFACKEPVTTPQALAAQLGAINPA
ncbi:MAG TPA: thioredoxin domain-containing protein [Ktedonobacterales bacterium]|nr:thioredoxin domain-containing protein [Ktedonobacterales bacterium]